MRVKVNPSIHSVVVIWADNHFAFTSLTSAVSFIEEQTVGVKDSSKVINAVSIALSDDKDPSELAIYAIDEYVDLFMDDSEDDSEV